ncbi:hypothetical protein TRFO_34253 [Tritrichomonas foetus]|uniref:BACK domain-containing protein n=1 Tax=Tritrichomonas foetus TaxID=1144522 RepID=A0A1J4JLQ9_9EUKA|nr:hypothetical protein TRFO_34253 [Tritrichomonas foetus]|eukprot:OHS99343.1 hypothetical protein TRFO_34253 [Tritrichomonas foetus]
MVNEVNKLKFSCQSKIINFLINDRNVKKEILINYHLTYKFVKIYQTDKMKPFKLSSQGWRNIHFDCHERDFTFIVAGREFSCNKLIADYLSPNVSNQRLTDSTISSYSVCEQCEFDVNEFKYVIALGEGEKLELDEKTRIHLIQFFAALGNHSVLSKLVEDEDQLNQTNAISILLQRASSSLPIDKEISFIAENFDDFHHEELEKLDFPEIQSILSSPSLFIEDEEAVFNFVCHLASKDESFSSLFEFVDFRNLSIESVRSFLSLYSFEKMNIGIWNAIKCRLLCDVKIPEEETGSDFLILSGDRDSIFSSPALKKEISEWHGIFDKLSNQYQGNLDDLGVVKTTSSGYSFASPPCNVLDFHRSNYFYSKDTENPWIEFEFSDFLVLPIGYSLRTSKLGEENWSHIRSWIVYGYDFDDKRYVLDEQNDVEDMKGSMVSATFRIRDPIQCKRIRIQQVGKNWAGLNFMVLSAIEIYGKILDSML